MKVSTTNAERLDESFSQQLLETTLAGVFQFVDRDTKTLITVDPATGQPRPYGIWLRALRIQHQVLERRWEWRLKRYLVSLFGKRMSGASDKSDLPERADSAIKLPANTAPRRDLSVHLGDGEDD